MRHTSCTRVQAVQRVERHICYICCTGTLIFRAGNKGPILGEWTGFDCGLHDDPAQLLSTPSSYEFSACTCPGTWYIATTSIFFGIEKKGCITHTAPPPAEFYSVWRICSVHPKRACHRVMTWPMHSVCFATYSLRTRRWKIFPFVLESVNFILVKYDVKMDCKMVGDLDETWMGWWRLLALS
jgi:hypothetical protein